MTISEANILAEKMTGAAEAVMANGFVPKPTERAKIKASIMKMYIEPQGIESQGIDTNNPLLNPIRYKYLEPTNFSILQQDTDRVVFQAFPVTGYRDITIEISEDEEFKEMTTYDMYELGTIKKDDALSGLGTIKKDDALSGGVSDTSLSLVGQIGNRITLSSVDDTAIVEISDSINFSSILDAKGASK